MEPVGFSARCFASLRQRPGLLLLNRFQGGVSWRSCMPCERFGYVGAAMVKWNPFWCHQTWFARRVHNGDSEGIFFDLNLALFGIGQILNPELYLYIPPTWYPQTSANKRKSGSSEIIYHELCTTYHRAVLGGPHFSVLFYNTFLGCLGSFATLLGLCHGRRWVKMRFLTQ